MNQVIAEAIIPASVVAIAMAASFLIALGGQLSGYRPMLLAGIALLFVSTVMMLIGGFTQYLGQTEPVIDPFHDAPITGPVTEKETIGDLRRKQQGAR